VNRLFLLSALLSAAAFHAGAQQLPYKVTIVDWQRNALERQVAAYRGEPAFREVLYCIDSWKTLGESRFDRVVIERVRRERGGTTHSIVDIGSACTTPSGEPLPMFHTHSDGNCQFSPEDIVSIIARRAQFEGVQCGDHHFIWGFAWQLLAVANAVESAKFK